MKRTSAPATRMRPGPQPYTLSVRISDVMRQRLQRIRDLAASKTGVRMSLSAVAKGLLESAREDRGELVQLLAHPTETLLEIRRKGDAGQLLSRAEWCVLAHFARHGMEAYSSRTPNPVSREALLAVLDAFLAVYALRTKSPSPRDAVYLGNLPLECRPSVTTRAGRSDQTTPDVVPRTATETRRRMSDDTAHASMRAPLFVGRNLSMVLEDEALAGLDAVNRALHPYWSGLWRLAVRGHYVATGQPVRERSADRQGVAHPAIPSITEGDYKLSFDWSQSDEFSVVLSFPGALGPRYPVRGYPVISEFRAMLEALASDAAPTRSWNGAYFVGSVFTSVNDTTVWFRAHDNGITCTCSENDWHTICALVRRAWEWPDVRIAWEGYALEYGEL